MIRRRVAVEELHEVLRRIGVGAASPPVVHALGCRRTRIHPRRVGACVVTGRLVTRHAPLLLLLLLEVVIEIGWVEAVGAPSRLAALDAFVGDARGGRPSGRRAGRDGPHRPVRIEDGVGVAGAAGQQYLLDEHEEPGAQDGARRQAQPAHPRPHVPVVPQPGAGAAVGAVCRCQGLERDGLLPAGVGDLGHGGGRRQVGHRMRMRMRMWGVGMPVGVPV
mmetsp:Transcript_36550/g.91506  ORF Transcript_36550/g.91506 Transcript_36550/m.91506 type:complete len:220 (+) Transcript_36550:581-1240(+)